MPIVRVNGPDLVVRYAGRRLRITGDWSEISEDALPRVLAEGENMVDVQTAPTVVRLEATEDEGEGENATKKRGRKSDDAKSEAPSGEEKE